VKPSVDVLIQPVCLRFRYHEGEIVYLFAAAPEQQLDAMERMLGIDPARDQLFDANLGFLPVASTVLIRGETTVLVDPGNHHIGFYGMLGKALADRGLTLDDIDMVVTTHAHGDHAASLTLCPGRPWVLGEGEFDVLALLEGRGVAEAKRAVMGDVIEIPETGEHEIAHGVSALFTPGHSPGHISLLVDSDRGRVLLAGDQTMTEREYRERTFSHWYSDEQLAQLHASLDRVQAWEPDWVVPGHDRIFRP
jgi:glyoxylase-like metal-dependent hydrolase (beta-lactamase superfamily II)